MNEIHDTDLAWAAGFLDGEGCFTLGHDHRPGLHPLTRQVILVVAQVDRRPLEKLVSMFGGKVRKLRITSSGKQAWQWRIGSARDLERIIPLLLPYLVLKKREAEIVLAFANMVKYRGRQVGDVPAFSIEEIEKRGMLIDEMATIRGG